MTPRTVEILPELFFARRGFLSGNHFILRARKPTLIDTAYRGGAESTLGAVEALGCDWRRTERIINTHCHCDHVGANRIIQEASGCAAAMHPAGRRIINEKDSMGTWWEWYRQEGEFFECGEELGDGEVVALGANRLTVIHTPGHSRDTLMLYCRVEKLLISSDGLWESDMPVYTPRLEGADAPLRWLDSLEKLAGLEVRVVFPGHGGEFTEFKAALEKTRARLARFVANPAEAAEDLIRKLTVYTLLMHGGAKAEGYFDDLMRTPWYPDAVDAHFEGRYREKYDETIARLTQRGAVRVVDGWLRPLVAV